MSGCLRCLKCDLLYDDPELLSCGDCDVDLIPISCADCGNCPTVKAEMSFLQGELGVFMACHQVMLKLIAGHDVEKFIGQCRDSEEFMELMLTAQHKIVALLAGTELGKNLVASHDGFLKVEKTKDGITSQLWKKGDSDGD